MAQQTRTLLLPQPEDTARLAQQLAQQATAGDCILLQGHIGAGKSELARAFIRARLGPDTEVPSPTFTLVQTYEDNGIEIWHTDLYRLGDIQEVIELGLIDAFATQISLVEWPELLGPLAPDTALRVELTAEKTHHTATLTFGDHWASRLTEVANGT